MENQLAPTSQPSGFAVAVSPSTIPALRRCEARGESILVTDDSGTHVASFRGRDGKVFHIKMVVNMEEKDFSLFLDPDTLEWFVIRADAPGYRELLHALKGHGDKFHDKLLKHRKVYLKSVADLTAEIKAMQDASDDDPADDQRVRRLY